MTDEFNLLTADKSQLKQYAEDAYGIALTLTMNEETMRDRILKHCQLNNLEAPVAVLEVKNKKDIKYVTINIAKQDKVGGAEPALLGHQGTLYTVPRGINVKVPHFLVEVLKNGVQDIVTQDPDSGEIMKEPVLTYPYNVIAA